MFPDDVVVEAIHARRDVVRERHGLGPGSHSQPRELLEVAEREAVGRAAARGGPATAGPDRASAGRSGSTAAPGTPTRAPRAPQENRASSTAVTVLRSPWRRNSQGFGGWVHGVAVGGSSSCTVAAHYYRKKRSRRLAIHGRIRFDGATEASSAMTVLLSC